MLQQLLIWLIVLGAVVALLRLFIPWVLQYLGIDSSVIVRAINIVVFAIVAVALVYFVFGLIGCLLGAR